MIDPSDALLAPYESGYPKNNTLQLTQDRKNQQIADTSQVRSGISSLFFSFIKPLTCCFGDCVQVQPLNDIIVSRWGVVTEVLREPGCYWLSCAGLETQEVYVGGWNDYLEDMPINDSQSFPCFISARYNYQVVDALSATYKIPSYHKFVKEQAKTALQKIFSKAVYNNYRANTVGKNITKILQEYVSPMGIQINSFTITSVKVSNKLLEYLMAEQEAQAYINGRKTIANGAVSISSETVKKLEKENLQLTPVEINALAVDLIYMIIQNDDVKIRFMEGNPSDVEAVVAITTETPVKPKKKEKV